MKKPRVNRVGRRFRPERYTIDELHRMCVEDLVKGRHTQAGADRALGWFAEAVARIAHKRGVSKDLVFADLVHDAQVRMGRPVL